MVASLVPKEGGRTYQIDKPIVLIGRHQDCDVALAQSPKVSRRHCCIVQCGERYIVRDLGSMNGVRVNGERIIEAELHPGDEISVADLLFQFHRPEQKTRSKSHGGQTASASSTAAAGEPVDLSGAMPVLVPQQKPSGLGGTPPGAQERASRTPEDDVRLADDSKSALDFMQV